MKKLLFIIITMCSFSVMAAAPLAKMEAINSNVAITFNDFADIVGFEYYKCYVDFGTWQYEMAASAVSINGETYYRCLDQGSLSTGVEYEVYITFENRDDYIARTPIFMLSTE